MSTNYRGYLIRFNESGSTSTFPQKYLAPGPSTTPDRRLEASAYRDGNGNLQRVTIENYKSEFELITVSNLTLEQKIEIEADMSQGLVDEVQRKYHLEYWDHAVNDYKTGCFYLKDITYTINKITGETIIYDSIIYKFIEY